MSKTKLDEIMEEVIPVYNGITDELESYELTKEQYKWFLLEAAAKEELLERVKELEKENRSFKNRNKHLDFRLGESRKQCNRFKQALDKIAKLPYDYVMQRIARQALQGGNDNE